MENITMKQFINDYIIEGIGDFIKNNVYNEQVPESQKGRNAYLAFALLFNGIELLGKCIPDTELNKAKLIKRYKKKTRVMMNDFMNQGYSKIDFVSAITILFPKEDRDYITKAEDLYKLGRCGICHCFAPCTGIVLTHKKDVADNIDNSSPIKLELQAFYDDFVSAFSSLQKIWENDSNLGENKIIDISNSGTGGTMTQITKIK